MYTNSPATESNKTTRVTSNPGQMLNMLREQCCILTAQEAWVLVIPPILASYLAALMNEHLPLISPRTPSPLQHTHAPESACRGSEAGRQTRHRNDNMHPTCNSLMSASYLKSPYLKIWRGYCIKGEGCAASGCPVYAFVCFQQKPTQACQANASSSLAMPCTCKALTFKTWLGPL
jgi:hypothetical protein